MLTATSPQRRRLTIYSTWRAASLRASATRSRRFRSSSHRNGTHPTAGQFRGAFRSNTLSWHMCARPGPWRRRRKHRRSDAARTAERRAMFGERDEASAVAAVAALASPTGGTGRRATGTPTSHGTRDAVRPLPLVASRRVGACRHERELTQCFPRTRRHARLGARRTAHGHHRRRKPVARRVPAAAQRAPTPPRRRQLQRDSMRRLRGANRRLACTSRPVSGLEVAGPNPAPLISDVGALMHHHLRVPLRRLSRHTRREPATVNSSARSPSTARERQSSK